MIEQEGFGDLRQVGTFVKGNKDLIRIVEFRPEDVVSPHLTNSIESIMDNMNFIFNTDFNYETKIQESPQQLIKEIVEDRSAAAINNYYLRRAQEETEKEQKLVQKYKKTVTIKKKVPFSPYGEFKPLKFNKGRNNIKYLLEDTKTKDWKDYTFQQASSQQSNSPRLDVNKIDTLIKTRLKEREENNLNKDLILVKDSNQNFTQASK